jgi:hypothetical protein
MEHLSLVMYRRALTRGVLGSRRRGRCSAEARNTSGLLGPGGQGITTAATTDSDHRREGTVAQHWREREYL